MTRQELCLQQSNLQSIKAFIYAKTSRPGFSNILDNLKVTINKYQNWLEHTKWFWTRKNRPVGPELL